MKTLTCQVSLPVLKSCSGLQVLVGEDEPPENALKRFRWASKSTGVVQEVGLALPIGNVFLKVAFRTSRFRDMSCNNAYLCFNSELVVTGKEEAIL